MPGEDQDPGLFWRVDEGAFAKDHADLEAQGINVDALNEKLKAASSAAEDNLCKAIRTREEKELAKLEREKLEGTKLTYEEVARALSDEGGTAPMRPISPTATTGNITRTSAPYKTRRQRNAERPAKKSGKTPKLEDIYRDPIKHGLCKIVRERGKAPRIVWL